MSRSSAASWGRSFSGPELAPRPARLQISSLAAQDAWGKGIDQQHSPASFSWERLSHTVDEVPGPAYNLSDLEAALSRQDPGTRGS